MRVLLLHNKYQLRGGEDLVFELEHELLHQNGHNVETLFYNNDTINSSLSKLRTGISILYNFKSANIIREKILSFCPDIIHIHNLFPVASPSVLFEAKRHNVPVVMTLHNYRLICPSSTLLHKGSIYENSVNRIFPIDAITKKLYRDSFIQTAGVVWMTGVHKVLNTWNSKISTFIALTEFARDKFINSSLHPDPGRIVVKPNFTWDPGVGKKNRKDYFLFAGRLTYDKGLKLILECAAQMPGIIFKIIGDGPMRKEIEDYASRYHNIHYEGFKERSFVLEQLKDSRALLMPTLCYEGFPMTILEAFATGTPVITSALGSMNEMVQDGENGLLFDTGNLNEFTAKIRYVWENQDIMRKISMNARKSYEKLYSPESNYTKLMDIYQDTIQRVNTL